MVNLMKVKMNIPKILNSQTFNKEASVVINKSVLDGWIHVPWVNGNIFNNVYNV